MGGRGGSPNISALGQAQKKAAAAPSNTGDDMQTAVLRAYRSLESEFDNEWVILTELRARLGGSREQQDSALMQLVKDRKIRLVPEENQKTLSEADRRAAIRVSGEDKHFIGIPR